jgi:hypothetical protein
VGIVISIYSFRGLYAHLIKEQSQEMAPCEGGHCCAFGGEKRHARYPTRTMLLRFICYVSFLEPPAVGMGHRPPGHG